MKISSVSGYIQKEAINGQSEFRGVCQPSRKLNFVTALMYSTGVKNKINADANDGNQTVQLDNVSLTFALMVSGLFRG
jgi:hypothetical protein